MDAADFRPEAAGYGQAAATAWPAEVHESAGPAGNGYPASNGYDGAAAGSDWAAVPEGHYWQEWQDWHDWGPQPELHPDHPSAPVPRVQFPADHPSGPMPTPGAPGVANPPQRRPGGSARSFSAPPQTTAFQRQPGPARRDATGYQPQTGHRWQETTDYRREARPFGPGPGPATERLQNSRSLGRDSLWTAGGQVLTLADGQATQIAQEAQDYAAAIREAAERDAAAITQQATSQAAAIREAAEREAAQLRTWLDSMSGELGRVAAYVTENLTAPAMSATAPALPGARPALPGTRSALPATRPARPDTMPGTRPAGPARPRTMPAKKPQRQRQAMRVATAATATLLSFAVITGAAELGLHGFKFFVFRAGGVGQTAGTETDQQFLARKAAAAHHVAAPKGRHHRKPHQTLEVHH